MICDNCAKKDKCTKIISENEMYCSDKPIERISRDSLSFLLDSVKAVSASTGMNYQEIERAMQMFEDVSEFRSHGNRYNRWR